MNAAHTPDLAPQGWAWVLAQLQTPATGPRPYYETMPQHGKFTDRVDAAQCADRIRGDRVVHPILIQLVSFDEDEGDCSKARTQ